MESNDILDLVGGFAGALLAIVYQNRMPYGRMLISLGVGTVSAVYGAPALDTSLNMADDLEHFSAMVIGMTAQTYLIPGVLDAAAVVAKLPAKWIRNKWGNHDSVD